jgi:hypothetical protein
MSQDDAKNFDFNEAERASLVRMDKGKVNIAPPAIAAQWFRLVSVSIGNGTALYPNGDQVQTVEPWYPPDIWEHVPASVANEILERLEKGLPDGRRYSAAPNAGAERAAWVVVQSMATELNEKQAKSIIASWVKNNVIATGDYKDSTRREPAKGVFVKHDKRPG